MGDEFEIHSNDTIPIALSREHGDGEAAPLQRNNLNHPNKINENFPEDTTRQKSDIIESYKNLESDIVDTNDTTKIGIVHLQFSHGDDGSTWSIGSSTVSASTHGKRWYRHPKVREHWKVVVTSFVLFFIGLCLCITGIVLEALKIQMGGIFMFFVIGVFCFIPGVYHVIAVYFAVKGKRGFSFYNLPLFN